MNSPGSAQPFSGPSIAPHVMNDPRPQAAVAPLKLEHSAAGGYLAVGGEQHDPPASSGTPRTRTSEVKPAIRRAQVHRRHDLTAHKGRPGVEIGQLGRWTQELLRNWLRESYAGDSAWTCPCLCARRIRSRTVTMQCPSCGLANLPELRFCVRCGSMLTAPPLPDEQRKHVTILFVDTVGSTRLLSLLDPERVRAQIAEVLRICQEEIQRYGGTVDKLIGDAVMAVFGLPAVHEEDPERAARAALSIKTQMRPAVEAGTLPEIRVGVNTGEVVATARRGPGGELLVVGEAINLAARLQQHAAPGQVLVGERTMRAIRHVASLRPILPFEARGVSAPLAAWELLDILPAGGRPLAATPFVDREEDLGLLRGIARRALRECRGHVVTILGTAGVGKTRLVQEFTADDHVLHVLRGRALPYGTGIPLWALGETVREESGILIGDPLGLARRKLEDMATALQVTGATSRLSVVLGLDQRDRNLSREALFTGLKLFFRALAQRGPLLLILEDLHVAEDVTLDFLEYAPEWIRDSPILFFLLSRPELLERRSTWMGGKRNAVTVFIDPLAPESSREIVHAALARKQLPDSLLDLILDRAGGNPLFVEEMVSTLLEREVLVETQDRWVLRVPLGEVAMPDTVNAVIAARVDALPLHEKQTLQTAAVVGRDFWLGALRRVADETHIEDTIRRLVDKELLVRSPRSTLRGEEEFTFRHILIRDVAYAMIPKGQRWLKHAYCAEWLEQVAEDRRPEYADVIAYHWQQVMTLRAELGLARDPRAHERSIVNYLLAGDRAATLYANVTAIDHYTKVLDLNPPGRAQMQALLGRGGVLMLLGEYDKAREDFTVLRVMAHDTGDLKFEAAALDRIGQSYRSQDQIDRALEYLGQALGFSRNIGDPVLTGRILNHIGFAYDSAAMIQEAMRSLQEARRLLEGTDDLLGLAESLHGLGENAMRRGQYRECIEWSSESAKYSEQVGNRSLTGENRYMIAISRLVLGEYTAAEAEVERSVEDLAEIGDVWNLSFALGASARIAAAVGKFGKALEYSTRGWELARRIGADRQAVLNLLMKGAVYRELEDAEAAWQADQDAASLATDHRAASFVMPLVLFSLVLDSTMLGRWDDAQRHVEQVGQLLTETKRTDYLHQLTHVKGRLLLALGKGAQARELAVRLSDSVDASDMLHWRVPASLLLADTFAALSATEDAAVAYGAAAEHAERLGCRPGLWRALAGLAEARLVQGQTAEAARLSDHAGTIIRQLATTVPEESMRAAFLSSPHVKRVFTMAGL